MLFGWKLPAGTKFPAGGKFPAGAGGKFPAGGKLAGGKLAGGCVLFGAKPLLVGNAFEGDALGWKFPAGVAEFAGNPFGAFGNVATR